MFAVLFNPFFRTHFLSQGLIAQNHMSICVILNPVALHYMNVLTPACHQSIKISRARAHAHIQMLIANQAHGYAHVTEIHVIIRVKWLLN